MRAVSDCHLPEWHVAFTDDANPGFIRRLLKPGFRHVWAFTFDPKAGVWLVFDPSLNNIVLRAFRPKDFAPFIRKAVTEGPVIAVPVQTIPLRKARLFMTCVSQVAHLIGHDLFLATPYQLFCQLRRLGYSERFAEPSLSE